ncbi:predicted protein [Histoplasma capsulatum H143]|uniref:Uncharacterized protein n=1 Tax=Ajellomyces capsulatus (strain H143) TaxID=544712 RepID=C6H1V2_AJECH|nr:predicted protein [Histoplasma capsulatum H143]
MGTSTFSANEWVERSQMPSGLALMAGKQNLFEFQPLREAIASTFRKLAPESRAGTHWPSQVPPYIPRCLRSYTIAKFMEIIFARCFLSGTSCGQARVCPMFRQAQPAFILPSSTVVGGPTFHEYLEKIAEYLLALRERPPTYDSPTMVQHIAAQPALDLFTIHFAFDWRPRMVDPVKPDQNGANRSKLHALSSSYFHGLDKLTLLFVLTFIPPLILSEPQPSARNTLVWRLELPDLSDPRDE